MRTSGPIILDDMIVYLLTPATSSSYPVDGSKLSTRNMSSLVVCVVWERLVREGCGKGREGEETNAFALITLLHYNSSYEVTLMHLSTKTTTKVKLIKTIASQALAHAI